MHLHLAIIGFKLSMIIDVIIYFIQLLKITERQM